MKHAGPAALEHLAGLLAELRKLEALNEKKPGIFYRKSRAFLHFHEDPTGLFADVRDKAGIDFDRFDVSNPTNWPVLVAEVVRRL
ncbi:MAG: hypothetical protein CFE28_10275 [Alphaproteobacteria bacterium PA2]|nr:MAG: hypothetical protein CFE28_10275 [Alphaproteobacteria bacterium PA2]